MIAYDHYVLTESLMAGNSYARWILADLLTEQGDCEEADFIRHTRSTRDGDLDVAIRQLPCPEVVELGCAFIEHVANGAHAPLFSLLARVRRLLRRKASAEQIAAACRGLAEYSTIRRSWYEAPLILLDDAVHNLASALRAASTGPAARDAGIAVTAAARSSREVLQQEYRVKKKPIELEWQIRRTRQFLGELTRVRSDRNR